MKTGIERRRSQRRPVLESFSLFVSVPKRGGYRLPVHDLSEVGIQIDYDTEGESPEDYPAKLDESFELQLFLNQSFYLPLNVKLVRILPVEGSVRRVGLEIVDRQSKTYAAYQSFLKMLDAVLEEGRLAGS